MVRALIVALAAPLALAPAASADTQYGGAPVNGKQFYGTNIALVRHDNGSVTGRLSFAYRCGHHPNFPNLTAQVRGHTDGTTFTATGSVRPGRGAGKLRFTLTGTFTPDAATGRIRLKAGCSGYTRTLQLKSEAAPTGAPAAARPDWTLFGLSNQARAGIRMPVALRVAKNGRVYASWAAALKCGRSTFWWFNGTPSTKVKADGTFSRSEHFVIPYTDGTSESYRVRFAGRFLADGAVGTLRATMQYHDKGVRYKTCRSGIQTWSAR